MSDCAFSQDEYCRWVSEEIPGGVSPDLLTDAKRDFVTLMLAGEHNAISDLH
jgi:hypothetical protein